MIGIGAASGDEVAKRSTLALAGQLGTPVQVFPGHRGGVVEEPEAFAAAVRRVLPAVN